MGKPAQNIWVFLNQRTNPAVVHNFTADGEPSAVEIHLMRRGDVDGGGSTRIETICMTGSGNTEALVHLPKDWETADWSLYRWPHGIFYVWETEYPDPHAVLAAATRKRVKAETDATPSADQPSTPEPGTVGSNVPAGTPPPTVEVHASAPEFDPADINHDGTVSKKERKLYERTHPSAEG